MRYTLLLLPLLTALGSCKSPPKPPTVDESTRRSVNSAMAVELQVCRSDLQNTRILASESVRAAEAASATAARLAAQHAARAGSQADHPNVVYSVLFAFGSTRFEVPEPGAARLVSEARTAPLILLRARTDGTVPSPAENRIARERAAAVQAWLVGAGVEPARIRATWQPVGDHVVDNTLPDGRTLNRRVEIEVYRNAPQTVALNGPPDRTASE